MQPLAHTNATQSRFVRRLLHARDTQVACVAPEPRGTHKQPQRGG